MRKTIFFMLVLPLVLAACSKSSPTGKCVYTTTTAVATTTEIANLKAWLDAQALPYTQHPSGIFYQVVSPGAGATAAVCSDVTVKYIGRLTNGNIFDNSSPMYPNGVTFTLGGLISGWQIGIPLIKKGGSMILYIPPSLGYGSSASTSIPANSILVFNIDLIDVQ